MQLSATLEANRTTFPGFSFPFAEGLALARRTEAPTSLAPAMPAVASLEDIRQVADVLGFVVVREDGLVETAWPDAGSGEAKAVEAFRRMTAKGMRRYVLTPIVNLDPMEVDRLDLYGGRLVAPAIQAMVAIAPTLRSLDRRVSALERDAEARRRAEEERRRWDPLLIAVPEGADIGTYSGGVALGPCWGPDLPAIQAAMAGLGRGPDATTSAALRRYWRY